MIKFNPKTFNWVLCKPTVMKNVLPRVPVHTVFPIQRKLEGMAIASNQAKTQLPSLL